MAYDVYQSAALILRYGFAAAGAFIAGRAVYMTVRDGRRARSIRADARETGTVGVFLVTPADGCTRRVPIGREGIAGEGRVCDTRIEDINLEKRHFSYEFASGLLLVTAFPGAELRQMNGMPFRSAVLRPGQYFLAGDAQFRFQVTIIRVKPVSPAARRAYGASLPHAMKPVRRPVGRRFRRA